jgi:general secretion pathway protein H
MTMRRGEHGYTLVELLVVLAIMGFLAAAVVPMLSNARPGLEAKAAARAVADQLAAARQAAIDHDIVEHVVLKPLEGVRVVTRGAIDFYPDGSSNGGAVTVVGGRAKHVVRVQWPTGRIAVDE